MNLNQAQEIFLLLELTINLIH